MSLTDLESVRQRFADAGDELHVFRIEEREQQLARRDHVAGADLLVDHDAVDGRADGGPIQRCLHFVDGLFGPHQVRLGRSQRSDLLIVLFSADGTGLDQLGVAALIHRGLVADRLRGRYGRLGLQELGLQVGVVQTDQDVALLDFLACFEVGLDNPRQQLRADAGFVDGADVPTADSKCGNVDQPCRRESTLDVRWLRLGGGGDWHFWRELSGQPQQEHHDASHKAQGAPRCEIQNRINRIITVTMASSVFPNRLSIQPMIRAKVGSAT